MTTTMNTAMMTTTASFLAIRTDRMADATQTVDARAMHAFLGVTKDFTSWIKAQLKRARLVLNRDYAIFTQKGVNAGRPRADYALTIEAGKHLAMMANTDKGFEVRDYFIECERRVSQPVAAIAIPQNFAQALRLAAEQQEQLQEAQQQIASMQPQVAALGRLAETGPSLCQRDAAKHLQIKPGVFTSWLISMGWTYRRTENNRVVAYQPRIDSGHLTHKLVEFGTSDGGARQEPQVRVTPKGLARLACLIEKGRGPQ